MFIRFLSLIKKLVINTIKKIKRLEIQDSKDK